MVPSALAPSSLDKAERGNDLSYYAALNVSNEEHIKARLPPVLSSSLCAFTSRTHRTGLALESNHGVGTFGQRSCCKKCCGPLVQAGWLKPCKRFSHSSPLHRALLVAGAVLLADGR